MDFDRPARDHVTMHDDDDAAEGVITGVALVVVFWLVVWLVVQLVS